jgi:hypothetical protein
MVQTETLINEVIPLAAIDAPQRSIASQLNTSASTVNRIIRDPEVKAKIDACRSRIAAETYEQATNAVIKLINDYNQPVEVDINGRIKADVYQSREHGFKAICKTVESIGIWPSQSPSLFIQQVYNTENTLNISSPLVDRAINQASVGLIEGELETQDVD